MKNCLLNLMIATIFLSGYLCFYPRYMPLPPEPIVLTIDLPTLTVVEFKKEETKQENQNTQTAYITHYGPDCKGCGGRTATGYDVSSTIYYNDKEYGNVRIVAAAKNIPFYSIIRFPNYKKGSIIAIVLDRGGAIKGNKIDLLVENENIALQLGIQKNTTMEILRWGK